MVAKAPPPHSPEGVLSSPSISDYPTSIGKAILELPDVCRELRHLLFLYRQAIGRDEGGGGPAAVTDANGDRGGWFVFCLVAFGSTTPSRSSQKMQPQIEYEPSGSNIHPHDDLLLDSRHLSTRRIEERRNGRVERRSNTPSNPISHPAKLTMAPTGCCDYAQ